jgi:hypothetical protein
MYKYIRGSIRESGFIILKCNEENAYGDGKREREER